MTKISRILFGAFLILLGATSFSPAFAETEFCPDGQIEFTDPQTGEKGCTSDREGEEGTYQGCTYLNDRLNQAEKCIFCPLFKVLFGAAHEMAQHATDTTAIPIRNVLVVGFAVYIAFSLLGFVSSFTKKNAPDYLTNLIGMSFKVLIAFLFLTNVEELYNLFINPLLTAGLDFGGSLLFGAGGDEMSQCKAQISGTATGILPEALYQNLECYIKAIQKETAFAQATGSGVMCFGRAAAATFPYIWDFALVFEGLIIYLFALLLSLAFAFYLIDAVVRLGIVGALTPFLIACWPFKPTSKYTSAGLGMLLNTFFVFIFMGIVISINVALLTESLTSGGLEGLKAALNGDQIDEVKKIVDWSFGGFLILVCCCIFGFKFCAQASALAGQMAGGGGSDIGRNIGTMLASPVVKGGKKIGGMAAAPITDAASRGLNKVYDGAKSAVIHPVRTARSAFNGAKKAGLAAVVGAGNAYRAMANPKQTLQNATNNMADSMANKVQNAKDRYNQTKDTIRAAFNGEYAEDENATPMTAESAEAQNLESGTNPQPQTQKNASVNPKNGAVQPESFKPKAPLASAAQSVQKPSSFAQGLDSKIQQEADARTEQALRDYEDAKKENIADYEAYEKINSELVQLQEQQLAARNAAQSAQGTPAEASARENLNNIQRQIDLLKPQKQSLEDKLVSSRQKMNESATSYYVNKQKSTAYKAGKGDEFNEGKVRQEAGANNLGKITAEIEQVLKAGPRRTK